MNVKCPACGAVNSLDSLVGNEAASQALNLALSMSGELGRAMIGYLGLFRPAKTALTFERVARLLGEILPDVERGAIERGGQTFAAPMEAWIYALNETVNQRHSLKLPLKSHGYLYEIISQSQGKWRTTGNAVVLQNRVQMEPLASQPSGSKTVQAVEGYARWLKR